MNTILVICEANICRSPMAEALLRSELRDTRISSAGLSAATGQPADPRAVQLMADRGCDISGHRSRQITRQVCLSADLILVMERHQIDRLESIMPEIRGRARILLEHLDLDVRDPYRKGADAFRKAIADIQQGLDYWLTRIRRIST